MFHDLDATLISILGDNPPIPPAPGYDVLPPEFKELEDAVKSFVVPDKEWKVTVPTLNLYLYNVKENRDLRDVAPTTTFSGGMFSDQPAPMRVECTYLITAWAGSPKDQEGTAAKEHELLGLALLWLGRFPVIARDSSYLQGSLKSQPYDLPMQIAQMPTDGGMGQFWTALGIAPRPSFSLTVTIAMQVITKTEDSPEVKKLHTDLVSITNPVLQGIVTDKANQPVPSATVTVKDTRTSTITDAAGKFRLETLAPGTYTLVVQATGISPPLEQEVNFTSHQQVFRLIVP